MTGPRRGWLPAVVLGVAGCLAAIALVLAVSALVHARVAEVIRWSPGFLTRLAYFDEQAVIVIAVVCAVIVAARARSAVGVAAAIVVGAAVAAVGGLVLPTVWNIGICYAPLSINYAHPPVGGGCLTSPETLTLRIVVAGAALVSILVAPAAYAAGMRLRRRIAPKRRPARVTALGWLAAAVAVLAAVAGTALWGSRTTAQGVTPVGSIGNDGWIRGYRYAVRLVPYWYDIGPGGRSGLQVLFFPTDGGQIALEAVAATPAVVANDRSDLRRLGARPASLDGAAGLLLSRSGLAQGVLEQWFVVRGPVFYIVTLYGSPEWPQDSPYLEHSYSLVLRSWRWTS